MRCRMRAYSPHFIVMLSLLDKDMHVVTQRKRIQGRRLENHREAREFLLRRSSRRQRRTASRNDLASFVKCTRAPDAHVCPKRQCRAMREYDGHASMLPWRPCRFLLKSCRTHIKDVRRQHRMFISVSESMIANASNPWLLPIHGCQCFQSMDRIDVRDGARCRPTHSPWVMPRALASTGLIHSCWRATIENARSRPSTKTARQVEPSKPGPSKSEPSSPEPSSPEPSNPESSSPEPSRPRNHLNTSPVSSPRMGRVSPQSRTF